MIERKLWLVLALGWSQAAFAQAVPPDPNCPLKGENAKVQATPGGLTIRPMSVKNPGPKDCKGKKDCTNQVEVQSFKRAVGGTDACCIRIEWGSLVVKKDKNVPLLWQLVAKDSAKYSYTLGPAPIAINPAPQPNDFDPPVVQKKGQELKLGSINGRAKSFTYGLAVFREEASGQFLACDPNDPVIVNSGP